MLLVRASQVEDCHRSGRPFAFTGSGALWHRYVIQVEEGVPVGQDRHVGQVL